MSTTSDRLAFAQALLDRHLHWIAAADGKAGFVVALDTAMIAGLAAIFVKEGHPPAALALYASIGAGVFASLSIAFAAIVVRPRTDGPLKSLVFFGPITKMDRPTYEDALAGASDSELLVDLAAQIHRNAEIAAEKHKWAGRSVKAAFASGALWIIAVALFSLS